MTSYLSSSVLAVLKWKSLRVSATFLCWIASFLIAFLRRLEPFLTLVSGKLRDIYLEENDFSPANNTFERVDNYIDNGAFRAFERFFILAMKVGLILYWYEVLIAMLCFRATNSIISMQRRYVGIDEKQSIKFEEIRA